MERMPGNPFRTEGGKKDGIYVIADVSSYLIDTGREHLCPDVFRCDSWKVEPVLLDDLRAATTDEERTKIRGLIRAVTNTPPDHRSVNEMLHGMDMHTRLHDEEWQHVEDALRSSADQEALEDALRVVEARYSALLFRWRMASEEHTKETLREEVEKLRPIRNYLYLRHVHPAFIERTST
jgi:uncharacterized protein YrzB (UPF0473 family)